MQHSSTLCYSRINCIYNVWHIIYFYTLEILVFSFNLKNSYFFCSADFLAANYAFVRNVFLVLHFLLVFAWCRELFSSLIIYKLLSCFLACVFSGEKSGSFFVLCYVMCLFLLSHFRIFFLFILPIVPLWCPGCVSLYSCPSFFAWAHRCSRICVAAVLLPLFVVFVFLIKFDLRKSILQILLPHLFRLLLGLR